MARFDLTDEEWAIIAPLLPKQGRVPERRDDRKILNGIFYILHTGAPWRDLPERYGPRTTVCNRCVRWGEGGVWQAIFEALTKSMKILWSPSTVQSSRLTAQRPGQKRGTGRRY